METLLHIGWSNALAATVLALLVAVLAFCCRRPAWIHSLWVLVLFRLLVPSVLEVPIPWPRLAIDKASAVTLPSEPVPEPDRTALPEAVATPSNSRSAESLLLSPSRQAIWNDSEPVGATSGSMVERVSPRAYGKQALFMLWLTGSALWLWLAWWRCRRFNRLVRCAREATSLEREQIRGLATRRGVGRCPSLCFVPAAVSPMLCAFLGPPRLFIPAALWDHLTEEQRDTLLLHELAHLRRRDHWVRRLEFVATALYWWHPVLWWARRQIQEAEEQCCDAWVAALLPAAIPAYAETLVATVTFLSQARSVLPLGASGMGHAHLLRRRLLMITRGTSPKGLSGIGLVIVALFGAGVLLLVPTWAKPAAPQPQDTDTSEKEISRRAPAPSSGNPVAGQLDPTSRSSQQTSPSREISEPPAIAEDKPLAAEPASEREKRPAGNLVRELPQIAPRTEPKPAKPSKKRIRVLARSMPWPQALDWLGKETGMPVIASAPLPEDNFNIFGPGREYTIPELVDLLNNQLKANKRPCLLVRGKTDIHLIPYEPNKPFDLEPLPRVTEKELDQHGDTELVILDLSLDALPVERIAKELTAAGPNRGLLGPLGRALAIPNSNQLILRDTVQNLKNIVATLRDADEAEKKKGDVYRHKCIYVKAEVVEAVLKDVLGIASHHQPAPGQADQPNPAQAALAANAPKNAVHVSSDKISNTVFVSGPLAKILIAKKVIEELEEANKGQPPVVAGPPIAKSYKIPGGNAPDVAKALKELYSSQGVMVAAVGKDSILVLARPEDQEAIRRYLERARVLTLFTAIPLYTLDAKTVYDNLTTLFDAKNGPAPTLDFDKLRNRILVRGTSEQVAAVKNVLKQLGENSRGEREAPRSGPAASAHGTEGGMRSPSSAVPAEKRQRLKLLEDKLDKLHGDVETLRQELRSEFERDGRAP
jgi:beta-lactamase regulating signal transducer with metallopeptidase domain